ncbi:MAG: hypothetical protein JO351_03920 [Candidatus Eremiobacteraeota bacterium]|nr:hypothetical protein [Candidatus Eremiobacteraeota bacterium]MBV9055773.1 hypothetical protein [Candidatus Eremiobacteraeota bacterium]
MRQASGAALWQGALLCACALVAVTIVAEVSLHLTIWGGLHVRSTTEQPFLDRITDASAQPALRTGDIVDLRRLSPQQRFAWRYHDAAVGERLTLPLRRDGTPRTVAIVATKAQYFGRPFFSLASWPYWLAVAGYFWLTFFAALIAWRRPDSAEARVLTLLLLTTVSGTVLVNWHAAIPALDDGLYVLGAVLGTIASAFLAVYAMLFAPASNVRRLFAWLSYLSVGIACAIVIVGAVGLWTLTIDPGGKLLSGKPAQIVYNFLPFLFPLVCTLIAIAETRGGERTRIAWATGSLSVLYGAYCVAEIAIIFFPSIDVGAAFLIANVAIFIAPLGLTYALLRRHLLDLAFVLNRAAIFATVSLIVVGLFVLFEWALGTYLARASHATNVAFSGTLALLLGLSVHYIHGRVEHVIDNLFFRKRHRDEQALRALANEAPYFTDVNALMQETIRALQAYADASSVTPVIGDGDGRFAGAEGDPAIEALRTSRKPIHLHHVGSRLAGEFAFPMVSRGRLMGALLLGRKRSGDSYAPDESDAIRHVAYGIGAALDLTARAPS